MVFIILVCLHVAPICLQASVSLPTQWNIQRLSLDSHTATTLQSPFKSTKHQTEPPLSDFTLSFAPSFPTSPADWGPLSNPDRLPSSRCLSGGLVRLWEQLAQQLFAGHPDRSLNPAALCWVLVTHLMLLTWKIRILFQWNAFIYNNNKYC